MNHIASIRPRSPLTALLTTVALIALVASCGGSKDSTDSTDSGSVSEKQASQVAKQYFLTTFGVLSGKNTPQQLIDLYAPECQTNADAQSIAAMMLLARAFVPGLDKLNIEDVDLGDLKYERNDKGLLVSPADPNAVRIKVDGKFVDVGEYFQSLGFSDGTTTTEATNEPLLVVKRDGKALIGDCSGLEQFNTASTGSSGSSGLTGFSGTVTISGPQATGPGSSRSTAIKLGDAATVEDTWKVAVLDVNEDAWDHD